MSLAVLAALLGTTLVLDFETDKPGSVPREWVVAGTNQIGPVATWQVTDKAFALVKANHTSDSTFNLAWTKQLEFRDGEISVRLKAVAGLIDQGGGVIWRVKDSDNYYLARINPLEDNFRIYVVVKGVRTVLASERVSLEPGRWYGLTVRHADDKIEGHLDGTKRLELSDGTLRDPGGIGLWTKSDAVSAFDDLRVEGEEGPPM